MLTMLTNIKEISESPKAIAKNCMIEMLTMDS